MSAIGCATAGGVASMQSSCIVGHYESMNQVRSTGHIAGKLFNGIVSH